MYETHIRPAVITVDNFSIKIIRNLGPNKRVRELELNIKKPERLQPVIYSNFVPV